MPNFWILREGATPAVMCAEALWWQCHRRIIGDYLLAAGAEVWHILGDQPPRPAALTPGALVREDGTVLTRRRSRCCFS